MSPTGGRVTFASSVLVCGWVSAPGGGGIAPPSLHVTQAGCTQEEVVTAALKAVFTCTYVHTHVACLESFFFSWFFSSKIFIDCLRKNPNYARFPGSTGKELAEVVTATVKEKQTMGDPPPRARSSCIS